MDLVILSVAKNLVLYRDVSPFLYEKVPPKERAIWVLRDEILRCAQNDRVHLWLFVFSNLKIALVRLSGRYASAFVDVLKKLIGVNEVFPTPGGG
jgi:hypothetical protein